MNTQEITIQGKVFIAPAPYDEGHVLTEAEASALNQTYGENLRNNFAARMRSSETPLDQPDFDSYASEYAFGKRVFRQKTAKDPVASEERRLAKDAVNIALKKKNIKVKMLAEETYEGYINSAIMTGKFRVMAEENVARAVAVADAELDLGEVQILVPEETPADAAESVAPPLTRKRKKDTAEAIAA